MTVKELREILSNGFIEDDLIVYDYDDKVVQTVNLVVGKDGSIEEIRFAMGSPG